MQAKRIEALKVEAVKVETLEQILLSHREVDLHGLPEFTAEVLGKVRAPSAHI